MGHTSTGLDALVDDPNWELPEYTAETELGDCAVAAGRIDVEQVADDETTARFMQLLIPTPLLSNVIVPVTVGETFATRKTGVPLTYEFLDTTSEVVVAIV